VAHQRFLLKLTRFGYAALSGLMGAQSVLFAKVRVRSLPYAGL
jgi:hypothetical protein